MRIELDSVKYLIHNEGYAWGHTRYLVIIDNTDYMYVTMNFNLSDILSNKYIDAVEIGQIVPFTIKEGVRGNKAVCDSLTIRVFDKGGRVIYDGYELAECLNSGLMLKSYLNMVNKYHMLYHMNVWNENLTKSDVDKFF